ncbi:hypothetical protein B0H13DRAFT_1612340 [Mycena leptocephala]|nr:hypothetical protein B0H13DRAFT_1612340 [Mycena leptocephala]
MALLNLETDARSDWKPRISNNLIDYVRADGSTMGVALVQAIDQTANMVWVDKPLNQAKSNVVNGNANTPGNPPMRAAINNISTVFPTFAAASDEIYRLEFFLRNLAALGQYFEGTSSIFLATALRVQNALSEITPTAILQDDSSIPLMFNTWLTNLINTYPNGCMSRGQAAYALYRTSMQTLAARLGIPVPACYPLYTLNTVLVIFPANDPPQLLLPPVPQSPRCNVPGTPGVIAYTTVPDPGAAPLVGNLQFGTNNQFFLTMGSGNTDFYAVGSGASISHNHIQGQALAALDNECPNSYVFLDAAPNAALITANIAYTCGNGLGAQDVTINFRVGAQALPSCMLVSQLAAPPWGLICSPTLAEATACAIQVTLLAGQDLGPSISSAFIKQVDTLKFELLEE